MLRSTRLRATTLALCLAAAFSVQSARPVSPDHHEFEAAIHAPYVGEKSAAREFTLCSLLLRRVGDVLTRSELLAAVWGPNFDGEPNVLDVYVGYLRTKLAALGPGAPVIRAQRGVGFRLLAGADGDRA